jgi:hypothetical protein
MFAHATLGRKGALRARWSALRSHRQPRALPRPVKLPGTVTRTETRGDVTLPHCPTGRRIIVAPVSAGDAHVAVRDGAPPGCPRFGGAEMIRTQMEDSGLIPDSRRGFWLIQSTRVRKILYLWLFCC